MNFRYQCNACGLQFSANVARDQMEIPCKACSVSARRMMPKGVSVSYQGNVKGIQDPNTGIASVDTSYDRVIGEDAENKWNVIRKRQDHKIEVINSNPGSTGFDLTKKADNTYRVMTPAEKHRREVLESHIPSIEPPSDE